MTDSSDLPRTPQRPTLDGWGTGLAVFLVAVFAGSAVMELWELALPLGVGLLALWTLRHTPVPRAIRTDPTPGQVRRLQKILQVRSGRSRWQTADHTFLLRTVHDVDSRRYTRVVARFPRGSDVYDVFFLASGARLVYHEIHPMSCVDSRRAVSLHRRIDTAREDDLREFLKETSVCYATEDEVAALADQLSSAHPVLT